MIEGKKLSTILKKIPKTPGIYKMIDKNKDIIYIGKAKNLNKRVRQYFQKKEFPIRTKKLLEKTEDLDYLATNTELEAVLLETNLIKKNLPKYNVLMKDDKNYVYIKISKEDFPRISLVRKVEKDNAKYFGPKTATNKVKDTLKLLKKLFPYRHCNLGLESLGKNKVKVTNRTIKYPCLDYYIKKCAAPCIEKCTKEEYNKIIKNIENFLTGKGEELLKPLHKKMNDLAKNKQFEKAAALRDKIKKVEDILEKQKVHDLTLKNIDVINYQIRYNKAYFNLFQIREGKLIGQENFILSAKDIEDDSENSEVLEEFIKQYFSLATDIPKETLIPHEINEPFETKSKLTIPQKGKKNKLLELSKKNAKIYAEKNKPSWQIESKGIQKALKNIQKSLKIAHPLKRIECYDISHLGGTETVGSMIVFKNGVPDTDMYRKFRIRTLDAKPDDYKELEEVLTRRFARISQKIAHKDYIFKKARKKDIPFIEKHDKIDTKTSGKQFFILEKAKKIIGFIAIKEFAPNVAELTNLWLSKKERGKKLGHKLVTSTINKTASKRIYGFCKPELKEYYLLQGFEEIKKIPQELEQNHKKCKSRLKTCPVPMVFDKTKHKPDKSLEEIPDLVIIDGGKGQLSVATKVLEKFEITLPHISLAKKLEEIFMPNKKTPLPIAKNSPASFLIQRARNEAHRFAISYQKVRRKNIFKKK